jgi:hypothetical protein
MQISLQTKLLLLKDRSYKYQLHSPWFDPNGARTHDLHSMIGSYVVLFDFFGIGKDASV